MDLDALWMVADRVQQKSRLTPKDVSFIRDVAPEQFKAFPKLKLPPSIRHPAGFAISGASVGTFLRSALLVAGRKALGKRLEAPSSMNASRRIWRLASCARIFTTVIRRVRIAASRARWR